MNVVVECGCNIYLKYNKTNKSLKYKILSFFISKNSKNYIVYLN